MRTRIQPRRRISSGPPIVRSNETTGGTTAKNRAQKPTKVRSLYGSFYIAADSPSDALQLRTNIYVASAVYIAPATLSPLYMASGDKESVLCLCSWVQLEFSVCSLTLLTINVTT